METLDTLETLELLEPLEALEALAQGEVVPQVSVGGDDRINLDFKLKN